MQKEVVGKFWIELLAPSKSWNQHFENRTDLKGIWEGSFSVLQKKRKKYYELTKCLILVWHDDNHAPIWTFCQALHSDDLRERAQAEVLWPMNWSCHYHCILITSMFSICWSILICFINFLGSSNFLSLEFFHSVL